MPIAGQHFDGAGDDVVTAAKPADKAALLTFSCCGGQSNVAVKTDYNLPVNEFGSYTGTHLIDIQNDENTTTVDGSWTIDIADISTAPEATSGIADSVTWVNTGKKASITHDGEGNFAITGASSFGIDLLVNQIDPYTDTKTIDAPTMLDITADGNPDDRPVTSGASDQEILCLAPKIRLTFRGGDFMDGLINCTGTNCGTWWSVRGRVSPSALKVSGQAAGCGTSLISLPPPVTMRDAYPSVHSTWSDLGPN